MFEKIIKGTDLKFRTCEQVYPLLKKYCEQHPELATFHELGLSEEGRPIAGVMLGSGEKTVSLIAGNHSDEPTGPETLRTFVLETLRQKNNFEKLFGKFRFIIVPHVNPDGEARNQAWIKKWPSVEAYLQYAYRERPGRDIEFGYPDMRKENELVSTFLRQYAPFVLHMSLHSMSFAQGGLLLIEKHWIDRTVKLRKMFAKKVAAEGLSLHDYDRKGEKGFQYIEPGFSTTPEGQAMRIFFKSKGDEQTANLFHDSSMEFVRKLGGDPLCLVTEIPLFYIQKKETARQHGVPKAFLEFKEKLPDLKAALMQGQSISDNLQEFQVQPVELSVQSRLQLYALEFGLKTIS